MTMTVMTSTRPYLLRAFYDWILDNNCTPYVVVNAEAPGVSVPMQHVEKGQIVLNISMTAVQGLILGNESITFTARFSGIAHDIFVPLNAVMAIYARENGRGMIFSEDEELPPTPEPPNAGNNGKNNSSGDGSKSGSNGGKGKGKGGHLKVVK